MLRQATRIANQRAQPRPAARLNPPSSCRAPDTSMIQPNAVKSNTRRSLPLRATKESSLSSAASPCTMLMPPVTASMIAAKVIQPAHFWEPAAGGVRVVMAPSSPEQPALLGGELLVGEDALVAQLGELPELRHRVGGRRFGRRRRRRLVGVAAAGVRVLGGPARGLAARDAVADGRGRAGHDGGAGDPAKQSGHVLNLLSC